MSLEKLLKHVPKTLEFVGEFGSELMCFLPTVYWLHRSGFLTNRKVRLYEGMESFYYFLSRGQISTKKELRVSLPADRRPLFLANRTEHVAIQSPAALFPDYRNYFSTNYSIDFDKPVCVIQNKYCVEWGTAPINYLPVEFLDSAFSRLKARFQLIYFRQGLRKPAAGFSADHNTLLPFSDREVLSRHPEVLIFEDLLDRHPEFDYNTLKNAIFSKTHFFLASQGGGTYHCALFSASLIAIHHKRGQEVRFSYAEGFYRLASNPAPVLLICGSDRQLERALDVFLASEAVDGRLLISPAVANVVAELKPPRVPDIGARLTELENFLATNPARRAPTLTGRLRRRLSNLKRAMRAPQ
jgi:hypothetical protein